MQSETGGQGSKNEPALPEKGNNVASMCEHGGEGADLESLFGPTSPTPRALMDKNAFHYKGTKSSTTTYFERRYTNPPIVVNSLPTDWIPHSVILEGMFLIQISSLP